MTRDGGKAKTAELTLGPVLFNWKPEEWRDFYYRMADEAPVADVYLGETVCSKRQPFFEPFLPEVIARLQKAKKNVILSSLAMVMNRRESIMTQELCEQQDYMVEANDVAAHGFLQGRPHVIGPFMNVYNEATLERLGKEGAVRFCPPPELPGAAIGILAQQAKALKLETEIGVFGRMPLAVSGRCYHARAEGLTKDNCQFVCASDPDGRTLKTLDGKNFLAINGIQTLSHTYLDLLREMQPLAKAGVSRFRISPHSRNMAAVVNIFHDTLQGKIDAPEGQHLLKKLLPDVSFANGFYHNQPGHVWQAA